MSAEMNERLEALLDDLRGGGGACGAGAVAATSLALAADVVAGAARASDGAWSEARGVAAQSAALRRRAIALARENADAFAAAMGALRPVAGADLAAGAASAAAHLVAVNLTVTGDDARRTAAGDAARPASRDAAAAAGAERD